MQWPKIRWPWRKKVEESLPKKTGQALRLLHTKYQKQKRMWVYIILSSLFLMAAFLLSSVFLDISYWGLAIPVAGIAISVLQLYRCNDVMRMLRQAHNVQLQIEKAQAEAEKKQKEAEMAANGGQESEPETGPDEPSVSIEGHNNPPEPPPPPAELEEN